MPEPIFENLTEITPQLAKNIIDQQFMRAKSAKVILIVFSIFDIACGLFIIIRFNFILGSFLFLIPLLLYVGYMMGKKYAEKRLYQSYMKLCPSGRIKLVFFYDKFGSPERKKLYYSQATDYVELSDCFIIYYDSAVAYVAKDGFTKGSSGGLSKLLQMKIKST